ncbi:MAG: saccharopine dehydrogenase NADP-binding domain-containing protein [Lachnospiraceae bacterium]|nr:saccharopine dehydrogenase NADP-binding domain-containing protein [Lachnospiraceae bacterium]
MIKFEGRIVQFGFGAVGKSFYEKLKREIRFHESKYFVITMDRFEFQDYINLGGLVSNFIVSEVTRENFREVFELYLGDGDLLIDFADTVGTRDICQWCAERNVMYINTGEADWPDHWYSIFEENELKHELKKAYANSMEYNKYPIVLHHGNNPGLVSHFVKAAISYIIRTQFKKDKHLKRLLKEGKYNEAAKTLGLRAIHVNDIDLQQINAPYSDKLLYSTWCTDSFWFEMLSEATVNIGTHERIDYESECNFVDCQKGFLEFRKLAADRKCYTYYPGGVFEGFMVPHEETVSIAKSLEVIENGETTYRPTVVFLYSPCDYATDYFCHAKVNDYPNPNPEKPQDCENVNGKTIIRGYEYPQNFEIVYQEKLASGTEYVGVLLMGERFSPVWVGNRIEPEFLYKNKKDSFWQTPTVTPVAMSALAALCWMLKHKDQGGIYFPDDIVDYEGILKLAEKYISKTIYQTFSKEDLEKQLQVNFNDLQMKDFFVRDTDCVRE